MINKENTGLVFKHETDILGVVNYHYDFYSRHLKNDRDIIVWQPYSSQTEGKKYPVIYMHDGQNLFNPATSFIGYDWKVDETIISMSMKKKMDEVIVVGIYNSPSRLEELNYFTEKGKNYSKFIVNELMPFIEENYPVSTKCSDTAIMGSSLGGLCSFQLIWNNPNKFGKAACMSNSFWVDNGKVFEMIEESKNLQGKTIYLDCGSMEKELIKDNLKMIRKLKKLGYFKVNNIGWHIEKGGVHSELDWAKRLHIPLCYLFGNGNANSK